MASPVKEIPVIWYQAASCSGDSVALLNTASPNVRNVLVDEIVPGVHINLQFQMTVMAGQGQPIIDILQTSAEAMKGQYLLVVEGSIPTAADGMMGFTGEKDGKPYTMIEAVDELGRGAMAVMAVGTCAAYGGIFAAAPNPSGSMGVGSGSTLFASAGAAAAIPSARSTDSAMLASSKLLTYENPRLPPLKTLSPSPSPFMLRAICRSFF